MDGNIVNKTSNRSSMRKSALFDKIRYLLTAVLVLEVVLLCQLLKVDLLNMLILPLAKLRSRDSYNFSTMSLSLCHSVIANGCRGRICTTCLMDVYNDGCNWSSVSPLLTMYWRIKYKESASDALSINLPYPSK